MSPRPPSRDGNTRAMPDEVEVEPKKLFGGRIEWPILLMFSTIPVLVIVALVSHLVLD